MNGLAYRNKDSFTTRTIEIGDQIIRDQATGIYSHKTVYETYLIPIVPPEPEKERFVSDFVRTAIVPQPVVIYFPTEEVKEPALIEVAQVDGDGFSFDFDLANISVSSATPPPLEEAVPIPEPPVKKPVAKRRKRKVVKKKAKEKIDVKEYTGKPRGRKKAQVAESPENAGHSEDQETEEGIGE
jgi:hypothetical protein